MGLGHYVVDAIVLEGRSPRELARTHHLSRSWIYELVSRYRGWHLEGRWLAWYAICGN